MFIFFGRFAPKHSDFTFRELGQGLLKVHFGCKLGWARRREAPENFERYLLFFKGKYDRKSIFEARAMRFVNIFFTNSISVDPQDSVTQYLQRFKISADTKIQYTSSVLKSQYTLTLS